LGLEWSGLGETIWQVEINPFCRRILHKHFPQSRIYEDVHHVGAGRRHALSPVDLICFGSPCQDISSAGKQAGLSGSKSRLFYECARVVEELRPDWVVVENVASGAKLWVDDARGELERIGYASLPVPIEARDVGALHRRARIFIVAHLNGGRERAEPGLAKVAGSQTLEGARGVAGVAHDGSARGQAATDALGKGDRRSNAREGLDRAGRRAVDRASIAKAAADVDRLALWVDEQRNAGRGKGIRDERNPESGFPGWFGPEPEVVRVVLRNATGMDGAGLGARGLTSVQEVTDLDSQRREALGNGVVPWCSEVVGYVIQQLKLEAGAA
jgi:site-specific DNA-cytosine methylase